MPRYVPMLDPRDLTFPDVRQALTSPDGLLAAGGDLSPARLKQAYYQGIFPWFNEFDPILWWSPSTRAIFKVGQVHASRSLHKQLRQQQWHFSINQAFAQVIHQCAAQRLDREGTWISPEIQTAYTLLHQQGVAHSIEVWQEEQLIGGLYGIAQGKIFCGESMFHRQTDASKAAMYALNRYLQQLGFQWIDAQIMNPHLASLGAVSVPRHKFIELLVQYRDEAVASEHWQPQIIKLN